MVVSSDCTSTMNDVNGQLSQNSQLVWLKNRSEICPFLISGEGGSAKRRERTEFNKIVTRRNDSRALIVGPCLLAAVSLTTQKRLSALNGRLESEFLYSYYHASARNSMFPFLFGARILCRVNANIVVLVVLPILAINRMRAVEILIPKTVYIFPTSQLYLLDLNTFLDTVPQLPDNLFVKEVELSRKMPLTFYFCCLLLKKEKLFSKNFPEYIFMIGNLIFFPLD